MSRGPHKRKVKPDSSRRASCAINGDSLTAESAGTCVVTATRRAKGLVLKFSSKPTIVRFEKSKSSAHSITIDFGAHVRTLNSASKAGIANFAKPLKNGGTVVSTGYAKGNLALASRRAASVARYLARLVRVHVTLRSVTNGADNKAILAT